MIRNFFPRDTRVIELCSAIALTLSAVFSALHLGVSFEMLNVHPPAFWFVLLLTFGITQLISLIYYPKVEVLRVFSSWFSGVLWVWLSVSALNWNLGPDRVAGMMMGIGNLYAFSININNLRILWRG